MILSCPLRLSELVFLCGQGPSRFDTEEKDFFGGGIRYRRIYSSIIKGSDHCLKESPEEEALNRVNHHIVRRRKQEIGSWVKKCLFAWEWNPAFAREVAIR